MSARARCRQLRGLVLTLLLGLGLSPSVWAFTFTSFDVPGALHTFGFGGNNGGQIVGTYIDADGIAHGFLFSHGQFTTIDPPGSVKTEVVGINNAGEVVGDYTEVVVDTTGTTHEVEHGFLWSHGQFTTIDPPGAEATEAIGINEAGDVVGFSIARADGREHGFLWSQGRFTGVDVPGATLTDAFSINNRGDIVGVYADADGREHGFLLSRGQFTTVQYPGAGFTWANAITNGNPEAARIVGAYGPSAQLDVFGEMHGFVLAQGHFTPLDIPGAASTFPGWISERGDVVGAYRDTQGTFHGFVTTPLK